MMIKRFARISDYSRSNVDRLKQKKRGTSHNISWLLSVERKWIQTRRRERGFGWNKHLLD